MISRLGLLKTLESGEGQRLRKRGFGGQQQRLCPSRQTLREDLTGCGRDTITNTRYDSRRTRALSKCRHAGFMQPTRQANCLQVPGALRALLRSKRNKYCMSDQSSQNSRVRIRNFVWPNMNQPSHPMFPDASPSVPHPCRSRVYCVQYNVP